MSESRTSRHPLPSYPQSQLTQHDEAHYKQRVVHEGVCQGDHRRPRVKDPPVSREEGEDH